MSISTVILKDSTFNVYYRLTYSDNIPNFEFQPIIYPSGKLDTRTKPYQGIPENFKLTYAKDATNNIDFIFVEHKLPSSGDGGTGENVIKFEKINPIIPWIRIGGANSGTVTRRQYSSGDMSFYAGMFNDDNFPLNFMSVLDITDILNDQTKNFFSGESTRNNPLNYAFKLQMRLDPKQNQGISVNKSSVTLQSITTEIT